MTTYKPSECHFGLNVVKPLRTQEGYISILLSVPYEDDTDCARDDVDEGEIEGFPEWLAGRCEAEALYMAPDGWSLDKTKQELEKIGFTHNPAWDADCVD